MSEQIIKRIFITGPPGGMWAGVDRQLRHALMDIDNTDWIPEREWRLPPNDPHNPNHLRQCGAYFNIGNEFGDWVSKFHKYSKEEIIQTLDSVFVPQPEKKLIVRTHKAHDFAHHLDQIMEMFPDSAIVAITNDPHKCLAHWGANDGHDHLYDSYKYYNRDYEWIWETINYQYWAILDWRRRHGLTDKTTTFSKKWIIEHFTKTRLLSPYNDGIDKYYEGIETLYGLGDKAKGLVPTVKLSIIPWKTRIEDDLNEGTHEG